jgi:hypothetical protein
MKDKMDGAMHGRDNNYIQNSGQRTWWEDKIRDLSTDWKTILKWTSRKYDMRVDYVICIKTEEQWQE